MIHTPTVHLDDPAMFGPFSPVEQYCARRINGSADPIPDLPVPDEFRQVFRDWAEGKVNFTAPALDSPDQNTA